MRLSAIQRWEVQKMLGGSRTASAAAPTSGAGAVGDIVYNSAPGLSGPVGWVCIAAGLPGTWVEFGETVGYATVSSNADFTLTPGTSAARIKHTGTLTADRAVTLATTGAYAGFTFRLTRTGGGAFMLNVGTGPLKGLASGTWGDFTYDGSAYYLAACGVTGDYLLPSSNA